MTRIIETVNDAHAREVAAHILAFGDVELRTVTGLPNGRVAFAVADDADVDPLPMPLLPIDQGGVDPNNPNAQRRGQRLGTPDVNHE